MALQLGFDGAVKLIGRDGMHEALDMTLPHYVENVERMAGEVTGERVYWRIVFALLSVHTAFEPNALAYEMLKANGRMPRRWRTLVNRLASVKASDGSVIQFAGQKAQYLIEFDKRWRDDPTPFMPNGDGSVGWRTRIQDVRGLARTKASFAVCLSEPMQASVICIDRHMERLLTGRYSATPLSKARYDECEEEVLDLAETYSAPPFAVQWALWDAVRGKREGHEVLMT
jgi:endonuclease III